MEGQASPCSRPLSQQGSWELLMNCIGHCVTALPECPEAISLLTTSFYDILGRIQRAASECEPCCKLTGGNFLNHLAIWVSYFSDAGFTHDMVKRSHRFLLDFIALLTLCCKDLPCSPSELPSDRWHPCLASWWMGCYCHCQKLSLKILVSGTVWQQNSDEYLSYSNPFCFSKTTYDAQTMGQSTCTQLWCFGVTRKW